MPYYHCSPTAGLTVLEPRKPESFEKPARVYMTINRACGRNNQGICDAAQMAIQTLFSSGRTNLFGLDGGSYCSK